MKKIVCLFVFMVAATTAMYAQQKSTTFWSKELLDSIGVKPDVQTKIFEIRDKANEEIKVVRQDKALGEEEKKTKLKELNKKKEDDIAALLTAEQQEKIKQLRKKMKESKQ